jgi:hypothetical protein
VILAQPPVSALIAWAVLGEGMTPLQMAGGAIILVAVFLARLRESEDSLTKTRTAPYSTFNAGNSRTCQARAPKRRELSSPI